MVLLSVAVWHDMQPALFDAAAAALWPDGAAGVDAYVRLMGFSPSDATTMAAARIEDASATTRIPVGKCTSWFAFVLFIFRCTLVSQYDIQQEIPGIVVGKQGVEAVLRNELRVRGTHHDVL